MSYSLVCQAGYQRKREIPTWETLKYEVGLEMKLFQECTISSRYRSMFQERGPSFQGEEMKQQDIVKMKRGSEKIISV
jgi:hypothetical protein